MKTFKFLFLVCIPFLGFGQKIIMVSDTIALKPYFKSTLLQSGNMIAMNAGKDSIQKYYNNEKIYIKANYDVFNKLLKKNLTNLEGLPNEGILYYKTYVNNKMKIDSFVTYIAKIEIVKVDNKSQIKHALMSIEDTDLKSRLIEKLKKAISEFKHLGKINTAFEINGFTTLRNKETNIIDLLASKPDTIRSISLENLGLTDFPEGLKRFKQLKEINLKGNMLREIILDKDDFPKLEILTIQENLLADSYVKISGNLKTLNLSNNYLSKIPGRNGKSKSVLLANNYIKKIKHKDIRKLRHIEQLNLYNNQLFSISSKISKLKNLKELDLYRNNLVELPHQITTLKNLEILAISHNKLDKLPQEIINLKSLKTLFSHHNLLKTLPELPESLETLDLGYNKLNSISETVRSLRNLKVLDYSNNEVSGDLDFLFGFPEIKEIYLFENKYASNEDEEKYLSDVFYKLVSKGITVK